jgi:hypothetical protein
MKFVAFWEYYPEDFEKLMKKKRKDQTRSITASRQVSNESPSPG